MNRSVRACLLGVGAVCLAAGCSGPGKKARPKVSAPNEPKITEHEEAKSGIAVAVILPGTVRTDERRDIAGLVEGLLCDEPGFVPVERSRLEEVLREQGLGAHGLADATEAARIGSLVQADLLVCLRPDEDGLHVSVVAVNDAKVLVEKKVESRVDIFLSAREIAELVLAASGRGRALEGRLTVGIGPIVNESPTGRLDKVGDEIAARLRARLRHTDWAVVLERRYPTPLLAEVDLVRAGLAGGGSETVPPADIVLVGRYRETARTFAPDAEMPFRLHMTITSGREAGEGVEFDLDGTSGSLDSVAREVLARIEAERGRLTPDEAAAPSPPEEIARLKKLALYLMSGWVNYADLGLRNYGWHGERGSEAARLAARAWENILLLGGDDPEAKLLLGVCLSAQYFRVTQSAKSGLRKSYTEHQLRRSCQLIEAGFMAKTTPDGATFYRGAASYMQRRGDKRMLRYVVEHPEVFGKLESFVTEMTDASSDERRFLDCYREALTAFDERPHEALILLREAPVVFKDSRDRSIEFLRDLTSHPHVGLRFFAETLLSRQLWYARDPSCVDHYARAYSLYTEAMNVYRTMKWPGMWHGEANKIHHEARQVCEFYGKEGRCRDMFDRVVSDYLESGRKLHDVSDCIAPLVSFYAREGSIEKGYRLCEKIVREYALTSPLHERWRVYELREVFAARRDGRALPGFGHLQRIEGPVGPHGNVRMTLAGGRLWAVLASGEQHGAAYSCEFGRGKLKRIASVDSRGVTSVAAAGGRLCFGTWDKGLYVLDLRGKPMANLRASRGELPYQGVINMCSDGEVVYASVGKHLRTGVVRLDPVKLEVQLLAPTQRGADVRKEPVGGARNLWWEPETSTLWVGNFYERRTCQFNWGSRLFAYRESRWSLAGPFVEPHCLAVCEGRSLWISARIPSAKKEARAVTMKLHPDETVLQSDHPLLAFVRDAAWDETRLWLPTVAGLYEVDRATGQMRCIAHKDGTPVYSILKDGQCLYLGARDGIYRYRIPGRSGAAPERRSR